MRYPNNIHIYINITLPSSAFSHNMNIFHCMFNAMLWSTHNVCMCSVCLLDNVFQPVVLQQAEPAEMDWLGEAAEKAAGQVRAGAHRLLWSGVLYTRCRPTATGDHKVMFRLWCESISQGRRCVTSRPFIQTQPWNYGISLVFLHIIG